VKAVLSAVWIAIFSIAGPFLSPVSAQSHAAPVAAATTAESPEIHELQLVEDKWSTALNTRDQYGLELVLSPLFVNVSASGDVTTRNQQIVATINQEDKTASTDFRVVTVRMLGDVAVANGTYSYAHKSGNGQEVERGVFTHVFQRQHGNWVCLNAQRTLLREDPVGKTKVAKNKTKSEAELPFHIPLFSKSDKSDKSDQ
jgi:hypothetical protein